MAASTLIDTGAILALLDSKDEWHSSCLEALRQVSVPLLTSEAVLTELFHFVSKTRRELDKAWGFLRSGGVVVSPIAQEELPEIEALMLRYLDRPMDFADATLVHLAQREDVSTVFTVDHGDFLTYRIHGRRRFRIVPSKPV